MEEYWTPEEKRRLKEAGKISELADIALVVLDRMSVSSDNREITQICGPMTTGGLGNLRDNMALFEYAITVAGENGFYVFNQLPFQDGMVRILNWAPGQKVYRQEILEEFYRPIFASGKVQKTLFLPDWQSSHGASWEFELLGKLGIPRDDFPIELLTSARIVNHSSELGMKR